MIDITTTEEARAAERERISAIKALDEAKERPVAAENVAMNSDMTVDQAKSFLAGMPVENASEQPVSKPQLASEAPHGLVYFEGREALGGLVQFDASNTAPLRGADANKALWARAQGRATD